jgi:hypothetical protein
MYRLLAALVLERAARGQETEILTWEWPCVLKAPTAAADRRIRVKTVACANLKVVDCAANSDSAKDNWTPLLLVADLGTAPVMRYRGILRLVAAVREASAEKHAQTEVVVGTLDPDGTGGRPSAWRELVDRLESTHADDSGRLQVLTWARVAGVIRQVRSPGPDGPNGHPAGASGGGALAVSGSPAPARRYAQLLLLIGRHPCLTIAQLATLLGAGVDRIRRLENQLMEEGLLRAIEVSELPDGMHFTSDAFSRLNLVEITGLGRRRLAGWLGLSSESATRFHGVMGNGGSSAGRRWRLLRTLPHTIGANGVFVALAVAAGSARRAGGGDQLVEWRSAAACERRHCKPDGYGCYRRDGRSYGFFLEYDRGTEGRRKYAAKFRAYYRYRDGGQAGRDYDGFPALLFVTTQTGAEERIVEQALKACNTWGGIPLPVLVTTTCRIAADGEGVFGRIWRRADVSASEHAAQRVYWPPRALIGEG